MKFLMTFIGGVLLGAGALFMFLRQMPQDPLPAPVVQTIKVPLSTVAVPAAADPMAGLPGAPIVPVDLSVADLPLAPGADAQPATPAPDAPPAPVKLLLPVDGIKLGDLSDGFDQPRGKDRHHEALDIMAPKGAKVFAVADGKLVKLFNSKAGGLTIYQFDPTEQFAYYYAHLDRYADGMTEGMALKRGDLIGYVGVTGNSAPDAPHLHFAVVQLTSEKQWWKGTPVNPFPLLTQ
ncbi:MAG: M23 family metallopeptidase [Pseudomonadota bacterium]